jgi:hypothetical protein
MSEQFRSAAPNPLRRDVAGLRSRKRLSASVTAPGSVGSNSWRVSPLVSITMWVLIESSCGFSSTIAPCAPSLHHIAHNIRHHMRYVYLACGGPTEIQMICQILQRGAFDPLHPRHRLARPYPAPRSHHSLCPPRFAPHYHGSPSQVDVVASLGALFGWVIHSPGTLQSKAARRSPPILSLCRNSRR